MAVGTYLFFGLSTAVLANPVFGRSVPPTPWAPEVLIATAILSGLLTATYVRNDGPAPIRLEAVESATAPEAASRTARAGAVGVAAGLPGHRVPGLQQARPAAAGHAPAR